MSMVTAATIAARAVADRLPDSDPVAGGCFYGSNAGWPSPTAGLLHELTTRAHFPRLEWEHDPKRRCRVVPRWLTDQCGPRFRHRLVISASRSAANIPVLWTVFSSRRPSDRQRHGDSNDR